MVEVDLRDHSRWINSRVNNDQHKFEELERAINATREYFDYQATAFFYDESEDEFRPAMIPDTDPWTSFACIY